jgi:phosphotransacetylase
MTNQEQADIEPEDTGEGTHVSHSKGRRAFINVRRELSDDELLSPAVQRMLIDDIERLEKEKFELSEYCEKFYEADKRSAILEEKVKSSVSQEVIFSVCLTVGSAALGYAPSVWASQPTGYISIVFGVVLIIGGIASKVVKR